ncbi:MAG TPA: hypothetical protein VGG89_08235 [Candidatus Baltobacteraceae bacterium]|jgi:hypothetical protein
MSLSTVRNVAAAVGAAILFAACGGHGVIPSQSGAPGFNAVTPEATGPCYTHAVQPAWIFEGSCNVKKLPPKGLSLTLAPYKGITVTVAMPKNNSKGNPSLALVDAVGGKAKDIKPFKGKAFPALPKTAGKSVIYIEAVNPFAGLKFTGGNLIVMVKAKKLPGKTCGVAILRQNGKKFSWFSIPIRPTVSGNTINEKISGGAVGTLFPNGLPAGPLYFNAACK